MAKAKARREAIKPRLLKKYDFPDLDEYQLADLERADRELEHCRNCNGECQKRNSKYMFPVIRKTEDGDLWIPHAFCKYGEIRELRRQCGKSFIPLKYAQKTFDDYEVTPDNDKAVRGARWFVREKPERGLYLYGGYGTGKTFLASIIAREYMLDFKNVIFGDVPSLMQNIKSTFDDPKKNAAEILNRYCECDLLVLDDLGAGQITEWNIAQLYQIVNDRYNTGLPIVVTSNHNLDELRERLGAKDESTAARIISRLREMTITIFLGNNDRRR